MRGAQKKKSEYKEFGKDVLCHENIFSNCD